MNELNVGTKIRCNLLIGQPIYEIIEVVNDPYYKLPNVKIFDKNNKIVLITDFDIIEIK